MKRNILAVILAAAVAAPVLFAQSQIPMEVNAFADQSVDFVADALASARRGTRVTIEPFTKDGGMSPLGEFLAVTIAIRLVESGNSRIVVVDRPARDAMVESDFVVRGRLFEAESAVLIVLQIIETETSEIVRGTESGFGMSPWVEQLLSLSAAAQGGADRFEPDSLESSYELMTGEIVEDRSIDPREDEDWYVFQASGIDGEALFTVGTSGDTDTFMEVFGPDDSSVLLGENDDASDANAEVTVLLLSGDTVWVKVSGFDSSTVGAYSLYSFLEPFAGDDLEPNDGPDQAVMLGINEPPIASMLLPGSDEDWYYFEFRAGISESIISVETSGDLDTFIELYNEDQALLLENDDGGDGGNGRIDIFLSESGRYFVNVRHYDATGQEGEYELSVRLLEASLDEWEPDNVRQEAQEIPVDGTQQIHNFTPADEVDWISFNLQATSTVEIVTTGDIDTYLELIDRLGNSVAEDDDSGNDYNSRIEQVLQRGTYYIQITQVEGDSVFGGEYGVTVQTR